MKNIILFFSIALTYSLINLSCAASHGAVSADSAPKEKRYVGLGQNNNNLADVIRKNTQVTVTGQHPNVGFNIRGINTIKGDTRPLFIIDGSRIGRSYTQANSALEVGNIRRIRVLKSLSELAVYGEDGVNGVIIIEHHKN